MIFEKHNLSEKEQKELLDPFFTESDIASTHVVGSLPYEELSGLRFEKLCYEVLCSEGKNPRYNGKSGQLDYGVDIITEERDSICVYQCKNIKDRTSINETIKDVKDAYNKVIERWINQQGLPKPLQFVYYSRQNLADIKGNDEYTKWRSRILENDEIDIQLWGKDTLDTKLRNLYAVVLGMFSERIAKTFCADICIPKDLKWERLEFGKSDFPTLRCFYEDWKYDRLYVSLGVKERFKTAISTSSDILVQGYPGSGKTTTVLALLAGLQERPQRIYYTVISDFENISELLDSVKKRAHLPSVFILDDCHAATNLAIEFIQRLRGSVLSKQHPVSIKVMLLMRGMPNREDSSYSDSVQSVLELDNESVLHFSLSDSEHLLQVLKKRLPKIDSIVISHAQHVFSLTGGDMKLATLAVDGISSADELLQLDINSIKNNVNRQYIHGHSDDYVRHMNDLVVLAMFDLSPMTDYLNLSKEVLCSGLVTRLKSPMRVRFFHSSLAQVLFYVSVEIIEGNPDNWNAKIVEELIRYFSYLLDGMPSQIDPFFQNLSSSDLSFPDFDSSQIISAFINSPVFKDNLSNDKRIVSHKVLWRLLLKASHVKHEAMKDIYDSICSRLIYIFKKKEVWSEDEVRDFTSGFFLINKSSEGHLFSLESQCTVDQIIEKAIKNFSLPDLLMFLSNSSPSRSIDLVRALTKTNIDTLVKKTIEQDSPISSISLALYLLEKKTVIIDGNERNLRDELERKITAEHLLQLIANNGTIIELYKMLEKSSFTRASELINAISAEDIEELVAKTDRSIGTLNLALRNLEKKTTIIDGKKQNLRDELEKKVTAKHLLRLIVNNGTIFELFSVLTYSTSKRAYMLIKAISSNDVDNLVDKTSRSVSTLDLALRNLSKKEVEIDGKVLNLREELEKKITAEHLRQLIANNGTIIDLYKMLERSSIIRAYMLIKAISSNDVDNLVDKTNRSIGTLNLALRDLSKKEVEIDGKVLNLREELEKKVTAKHLHQLITNNGTIIELFRLLQYSSINRAAELIRSLTVVEIVELVEKTNPSIESIYFTFRYLNRLQLLDVLLELFLPQTMARLIMKTGTLNTLMKISEQLPERYLCEFRLIMSQYTKMEWRELVFRGMPGSFTEFLLRDIQHYPKKVRDYLENIINVDGKSFLDKKSWFELNAANYDSDDLITTLLRSQLELLLESKSFDMLLIVDFKEVTNGYSIFWRHATQRHDELNAWLWKLLPEIQWPKNYEFGFIGEILRHLCHEDFNKQNAHKLLCKIRDHSLKVDWSKAKSGLLFSFFWRLWQASYQFSPSNPSKYFPHSLSNNVINLLKKFLFKRIYDDDEKITLYSLVGLMFFLRSDNEQEFRNMVSGKMKDLNYLRKEIFDSLINNTISISKSYFSLYGMGLVSPLEENFTQNLKATLKTRLQSYPYTTKALEKIFSDL